MTPLIFPDYSAEVKNGMVSPAILDSFRQFVFSYYETSGRHDMIWRHTTDPYLITVSEIMLQQTQVSRVETIYPQFISRFPTFNALAMANESEVLAAWQGMGYNRRALSLHKLSRIIVSEYNGILPDDPEILVNLPGIGPATSCSITAFAFNRPVVFIETNIRRIFIHCFFRSKESVDDAELLPLVESALPQTRAREWYWALMDLGSVMKPVAGNPNRKSKQYVKQSTFAGSIRQVRGEILKYMLKNHSADANTLSRTLNYDITLVEQVLNTMIHEGFFIRANDGTYRVNESQP